MFTAKMLQIKLLTTFMEIFSNPPIMDMSVHVSQQSIPETSDDVSHFVTVTPVSSPSR